MIPFVLQTKGLIICICVFLILTNFVLIFNIYLLLVVIQARSFPHSGTNSHMQVVSLCHFSQLGTVIELHEKYQHNLELQIGIAGCEKYGVLETAACSAEIIAVDYISIHISRSTPYSGTVSRGQMEAESIWLVYVNWALQSVVCCSFILRPVPKKPSVILCAAVEHLVFLQKEGYIG